MQQNKLRSFQNVFSCSIFNLGNREARKSSHFSKSPFGMESNPPFQKTYKKLLGKAPKEDRKEKEMKPVIVDGCEIPLIDLNRLNLGDVERNKCKREIVDASSKWGFFQVKNHGISRNILERIRREQVKVFREPFEKKENERILNLSQDCYSWGGPNSSSLKHLSWYEAFHIPLATEGLGSTEFNTLRSTIWEFASAASSLALRISVILAENVGQDSTFFVNNCSSSSGYLRLNRYPPCPISSEVYGLIPHTDSDFLTILSQDQVGGLQILKDGRWITINPIPDALIVNIGDFFEAWSNGAYKSALHKVMVNPQAERFSVAFFMCPSSDIVIESYTQPSVYRKFTFKEFRQQVREDVRTSGYKVGLPRFLI
ncbi:gibberellin 2-beta-dioxygenase 8-like [Tasmannia lanceolata]|uniref:gibberellin 2-beta-dioxygenase 8-like n=1 Tax=Tasmannia lanceolata TaxID=3420 RepID=UPI0040642EA6